ncbi:hypothetical protein [Mechercharimyces sp. CAU 1602]|uniref:hypothetical protein n=1 Tax=Mechercharimyces sp. CAU 1602 TaxID=2973933 RepID=UPI002161EDF0|nr:hypothetical protein [Mechercharimyces sp. CAU 1602]MCS1351989.1 hypothetical protein [Mechercharimyces sp. CAU 1602]
MYQWDMLYLWEWQAMMLLTFLSSLCAWWTRKRIFECVALGGMAILLMSLALWEPVRPLSLVIGLSIGALLLIWMAKRILDPGESFSTESE